MAAASSCSDTIPRERYDVFLSFRGEDTRNTFTSHLYEALCQKKILTYKDDEELERGCDISPALRKAISESKLSVIIFSKDYASSTWCLEELAHIGGLRDKQFVIPIFYGIVPSDVRHQSGSYADAFVKHEERFKDKVVIWRDALKRAANISGFDSQTIRPESYLVKVVVDDILEKLNRKLQAAWGLKGLVGMEKHIQQVELLLCLNSLDVQIVGIWGMGGIGKTTIAEVVFDRLSSQFEACCFIANVRESEAKHGLNDLWNQILRTLLKEENPCMATPSIISTFARDRIRRTRALIVLDDVSEFSQLGPLAGGDCNLFGPGSRILVTTRNKRILRNLVNDDEMYEVKKLDVDEALELFQSIAFGNKSPPGDYTTSAKEVVDYAGGNPLALKILGGVFCGCESKEEWDGELERLKDRPNKEIQNVLKFSYDGLEENERGIFLDIACYHKGKSIGEAKRILDSSGFIVNAGVKRLIDMSLISVDKSSRIVEMHDLIQEMGREIVRDECVKDPGKRSRLWLANEVCRVLKSTTGTEDIECIAMNMDDLIRDLYVNAASFEKMRNLRLLDLYSYNRDVTKVHLPPGFEFLPEALKYLRWHFYPLTSLPSRFSSENLVELHMRNSRLEQLWNKGVQINLGSLKRIDLAHSKHLAEVPDLIESPILESICLAFCTSLVQLHSSFQHLDKLTCLNLNGCSNLKILPEMPGNLETLYLEGTAIEELPSSIWSLEKLYQLDLGSCEELKNLPSSTCRLNSLRSLSLKGCLSLESLPVELPPGLLNLNVINCKRLGSLPVELPPGLLNLNVINCKKLGSLPVELPPGLLNLNVINCKRLGSLPVELPSGLKQLDLRDCESLGSLPKLPRLLEKFDAHGCTSLERVSSSMRTAPKQLNELIKFREHQFSFINCVKLDQSARSNIMADAQLRVMRIATESRLCNGSFRIKIVCPGNEIPKWVRYQSEGCSINIKLPPHSFRQGFLGYALCIVLAFNNYTPPPDIGFPSFFCKTHHKTNNGRKDRCDLDIRLPGDIILNSDHVFLWYIYPDFVQSESTINREDWVKASEVSFDFMLYHYSYQNGSREKNPLDLSTVRVERCGVSLLYDEDVVMEPKQVVEKEEIIIKTKRRRDQSEPGGSRTAILKEEDDGELLPQSRKRKINMF